MTEVAYWSLFFLPTVLRYGAHCYLQVGLGLSFSLSWNTRSLAGRGVPVNTPHRYDALEPRDERESEGAYLARHSLLLPGERKRLKKILNRSR
jgi:hypothetical protein